jgi:hypothetical protein
MSLQNGRMQYLIVTCVIYFILRGKASDANAERELKKK